MQPYTLSFATPSVPCTRWIGLFCTQFRRCHGTDLTLRSLPGEAAQHEHVHRNSLQAVDMTPGTAEKTQKGFQAAGGGTVEAHLGAVVLDTNARDRPARFVPDAHHEEVRSLALAMNVQLGQHGADL